MVRGKRDNLCDLVRRRGCEDHRRTTMIPSTPVAEPRRDIRRIGYDTFFA